MSYVDIHCHILPAVDDGARDLEESVAYARRLVDEGVRELIATPHVGNPRFPFDPSEVADRVAALSSELEQREIPLRIHVGGELHPSEPNSLSDDQLELIANGPPGARWLLFEIPFAGVDQRFADDCRELMARGFGLVIAHPERARGLFSDGGWQLLRGLVAEGALLQINVCSLLGNNGLEAQEAAVGLLRSGYAFTLASDAHPGTRDHTAALGFALTLKAGASSLQAWRLTQANPRFLLRSGIPAGFNEQRGANFGQTPLPVA
jgi:protein-tyrosine phosphatase